MALRKYDADALRRGYESRLPNLWAEARDALAAREAAEEAVSRRKRDADRELAQRFGMREGLDL